MSKSSSGPVVDKARVRDSLSRMWEIFREIGEVANQVSTWRCPYKNMHDRCTARFGCRNQLRSEVVSGQPLCTGSDKLDYRGAWEI